MSDTVRIPEADRFESTESYYATLFHELAHSTGHPRRLNREAFHKHKLDTHLHPFGSTDYSREELIAEMGAAFLAASTGISPPTIEQSAAYINGWRQKLKGDKKLIIQAAGAGQRAADHILGVTWDDAANTIHRSTPPEATAASSNDNAASVDVALRVQLRKLKDALQAFPQPGQANLNSTATHEERSAYISAVLGWWNDNVEEWIINDILDPRKNPVVNSNPAPVRGNFPANVPGCGFGPE